VARHDVGKRPRNARETPAFEFRRAVFFFLFFLLLEVAQNAARIAIAYVCPGARASVSRLLPGTAHFLWG